MIIYYNKSYVNSFKAIIKQNKGGFNTSTAIG